MSLPSPIAREGWELLDSPEAEPALVRRNLRDIARANRWFGGRASLRYGLAALLADRSGPVSLLDIGTGAGDLPSAAVAWGRRRGLAVLPVGLERLRPAASAAYGAGLATFVACASAVPLRPKSIDVVLVSQVLHHFHPAAAHDLLVTCDRLARLGVLVLDLRRTGWAGPAFRLGGGLLGFDPVTLRDGVTSIRRGYRPDQLRAILARAGIAATVVRRPWSRLVAYWTPGTP